MRRYLFAVLAALVVMAASLPSSVQADEACTVRHSTPPGVSGVITAPLTMPVGGPASPGNLQEVDVLFVYDDGAVNHMGGVQELKQWVTLCRGAINAAFLRSGVWGTFRTVGIREVALPAGSGLDIVDDLPDHLEVSAIRDQLGADLVFALSNRGGGAANRPVVPWDKAAFAYVTPFPGSGATCIHEGGHPLGMDHDPANAPPPGGDPEPMARGKVVCGEFKTAMSYAPSPSACSTNPPTLPAYSNPERKVGGTATGTSDVADNADVANRFLPLVAAYRPTVVETAPSAAPCASGPEHLCLADDRFRTNISWVDHHGNAGEGQAVELNDSPAQGSGYFWFFNLNNVELIVKVKNACVPSFNRFWVFTGGLTNVEWHLRVEDTQTQEVNFYHNELGVLSQPVADTQAFATCP